MWKRERRNIWLWGGGQSPLSVDLLARLLPKKCFEEEVAEQLHQQEKAQK
jgi:hypothetical protein